MAHPRCVGWGEIGLDYHYDNSPREIQQHTFIRQLRQAVKLAKPLTIHTREADEDTFRILKEEVPKDHRVSRLYLLPSSNSLLIYYVIEKDTHSLFHRHPRIRQKTLRPLPKPIYWSNRYFSSISLAIS